MRERERRGRDGIMNKCELRKEVINNDGCYIYIYI